MKKSIFIVFFVFSSVVYSQSNNKRTGQNNSQQFSASLYGGLSNPSSAFSESSFASNGNFINGSFSYYFSQFGLGLDFGTYSNKTIDNLNNQMNNVGLSALNSSDKWNMIYAGIGPDFRIPFGNFDVNFIGRVGIMSVNDVNMESIYSEGDNADLQIPLLKYTSEKSSTPYFSTGMRVGYRISQNFEIFLSANYLSAFSNSIEVLEGKRELIDINQDGIIDLKDILASGDEITATSTKVKPQTMNYGIGITYNWSNKNGGAEKPYAREQSNPYFQQNDLGGDMVSIKNSGSVTFTNPSKERKKQQRKIVQNNPKNNVSFKSENDFKKYSWSIIGERIMRPQYIIEVSKLNSNLSNEWVLTAKTDKTELNLETLFEQNKHSDRVSERLRHKERAVFTEGQYKWKVTEITTGISSNYSFFNFSNCEIDFAISNEEIECLGYEGEDRKYKICFDATYSSPNGDLTYLNPGSGLTVYDQTFATLTATLVSPNPTLVSQIGTSTSTASYCFEVTVSSSVTSIGFGLQGDDLDPSPIVCQPGVSAMFDELPDCICDECEEIELSFDDFSISMNGAAGSEFNFDGNVNVNVPIYGIEFQVQSYSYSARPSPCTNGVNSVEESGMILMPSTSINGSTTLEMPNESVSGSPSSNNNASKFVKYTSNTALSGAIPVNLTIGLPGPISGLDPSCCIIDYTVCIKVRVFYDEGSCKSCVFAHCFEFNNQ